MALPPPKPPGGQGPRPLPPAQPMTPAASTQAPQTPGAKPAPATQATKKAAPTQNVKPSQFSKMPAPPPPEAIEIKPLKMPGGRVNAEFCLENAARILEELAETQDDPEWESSFVEIATSWQAMAELLLNHELNIQAQIGDINLKQQEMAMQHELHQQTMAQNDQMHQQKVKQNDEQHKVNMKMTDQQNKIKMKVTQDSAKLDLQAKQEQAKLKIQQQKEIAAQRKANAAKPKPKSS